MTTYAGYTDAALRALCAGAPGRGAGVTIFTGGLNWGTVSKDAEAFYDAAKEALPAALDRVAALEAALAEAESDREALMEGLGLDPSPEALAEQRAQFGTEGLVWRWRDEIATRERARLEAELERLRERKRQMWDEADRLRRALANLVYTLDYVKTDVPNRQARPHLFGSSEKPDDHPAIMAARAALGEASHE